MNKLIFSLTMALTFAFALVCAAEETAPVPCISAPYDYEYQDESKQIAIRKFSDKGVTYFVADVRLSDASGFKTALSNDMPMGKLEKLSKIAARNGAVLAINGDDYGTHKFGTIIRNGELLRAQSTTRHMLAVDANGDFTVRSNRSGEDPALLGKALMNGGAWQTFEFGPVLVQDGQGVRADKSFDLITSNPSRREPRTAIGQIGALHYVVVVADGRQDGYSKGMTLPELQALFLGFGAKAAINLDGGGSAEMWFDGEIITRPAGGKERKISDILYF